MQKGCLLADNREFIDLEQLQINCGGDVALVHQVANVFIESAPQLLADIATQASAGNAIKMGRAAHTLKGSASNFGGHQVVAAARELEEMGRRNDISGAG